MNKKDSMLANASLAVSALLIIGGIYTFLQNGSYMEKNHGWFMLAYFSFCAAFYFTFKAWKLFLAVPSFILALACLGIIVQKFEWRKDYVDAPTPFFLEEYITEYPAYEDYIKSKFLDEANWVDFSRDCAEPAVLGQPAIPECSSISMVQTNYGINLRNEVNAHFRKMQNTARRVERGQMKTARQYMQCVQSKSCAEIPMLPPGVKADEIAENSNKHMDIRKAYWQLIDEKKVTPEVCDFMKLCKVMLRLNILDKDNFKL